MATRIDARRYRISNQQIPDDEVWEFQPGSLVAVTEKSGENGKYIIAVQLKS
ncbi:MAG TPA: hypothetical protein VMF90_13710 [Rhizobiaceae bacterium]|nr:hypothetical protein [Rhizobiaceae bacterium]